MANAHTRILTSRKTKAVLLSAVAQKRNESSAWFFSIIEKRRAEKENWRKSKLHTVTGNVLLLSFKTPFILSFPPLPLSHSVLSTSVAPSKPKVAVVHIDLCGPGPLPP